MGNIKRTLVAAAVSVVVGASFTAIHADDMAGMNMGSGRDSDSNSMAGMGAHMTMGAYDDDQPARRDSRGHRTRRGNYPHDA